MKKNGLNEKKNVLNDYAIWHILWNIPLAPFARGIHHKSNIKHHTSYIKNINHHEQISLAKNPEHRHHGAYRHRHHLWRDLLHGSVITSAASSASSPPIPAIPSAR